MTTISTPISTSIDPQDLARVVGGAGNNPHAQAPGGPIINNNVVAGGAPAVVDSNTSIAYAACLSDRAKEVNPVVGFFSPSSVEEHQAKMCGPLLHRR
jgi:hypothetical protein